MSFLDTIRDGLGSLVAPARSFLGSLVPTLGSMAGGYLGGPVGAALGGAGGSFLGSLIRGNEGESYANPGLAASNMFRSAIPSGYGNMTFNNMGKNAMNYAGNAIDSGISRYISPMAGNMGIGNSLIGAGSNWLSNRFRDSSPSMYNSMSSYGRMTPNEASYGAGNYLNSMLPNVSSGNMPGGFSSPGGNYGRIPMRGITTNPGMTGNHYASGGYVDHNGYDDDYGYDDLAQRGGY